MPILTLHLLKLNKVTDAQSFIHQLKQSTKIVVSSRPRHIVIHPSLLDNNPLATTNWDLLLLLQNSAPTEDPIPSTLRQSIQEEYKLTTGIPSKLLGTYSDRDADLKAKACSIPLTGSLDEILKGETKTTSQNLEVSPELLDFMRDVSKTHPGPVTMLNLLHFHHPDGKQNYFQYGQAFVPVAGKRGGSAKLVGNVVPPQGWDSPGIE
ncbi:hypothetical protein N7520_006423 [Penicillium odoratum]|uniref:uncharacterized protein n=1 Tax=Penicillium odoratum TaxID=1167516 RepID=UPI0025488179|nr:uncharacterized protein N7520_006423 [Penicillium odoratum]KAJ5759267.1 hypothetical protein N7520_006423 [Penicillium odoratum]